MTDLNLLNGLANIILVSVLVGVTWWYARSMKKQVEIMERQMERPKIIEVCRILSLLYRDLDSEIKYLKIKRYEFVGKESGCIKKLWSSSHNSLKFIYFKEKLPTIVSIIEKHDQKVESINQILKKLYEMILTPAFEEKCIKFIFEFNTKYEKEIKDHKFLAPRYDDIPFLVEHIIDNEEEIREGGSYMNFWNEYRSKLLEIRNQGEVKREIENLYSLSKELEEISISLKNDIERKLLDYKDHYHVTDEEILPYYL